MYTCINICTWSQEVIYRKTTSLANMAAFHCTVYLDGPFKYIQYIYIGYISNQEHKSEMIRETKIWYPEFKGLGILKKSPLWYSV